MRELDPLVSRAPIEKAGPAHIATLKTFDAAAFRSRRPPLRRLAEARQEPPLSGRGRGSRAARPPDERRKTALPRRPARRGRRRRCSACVSPTAASSSSPRRGRRSVPASGSCRRHNSTRTSRTSAPTRSTSTRPALGEILHARATTAPPAPPRPARDRGDRARACERDPPPRAPLAVQGVDRGLTGRGGPSERGAARGSDARPRAARAGQG